MAFTLMLISRIPLNTIAQLRIPLSKMATSRMALNKMTLSYLTIGRMPLSRMSPNWKTFGIMTSSRITFNIVKHMQSGVSQLIYGSAECYSAKCRGTLIDTKQHPISNLKSINTQFNGKLQTTVVWCLIKGNKSHGTVIQQIWNHPKYLYPLWLTFYLFYWFEILGCLFQRSFLNPRHFWFAPMLHVSLT